MAGRNHIPAAASHRALDDGSRLHRRLTPADIHLLEDRVAARSREIQTLLLDNQRLAATHVAMKQEAAAANDDVRRLSAAASSVKAERDAQVREVYDRSLELEVEARSVSGVAVELERVRADITGLRAERDQLAEKLKDVDGDVARNQSELRQLPELKAEIGAVQREIQRGRAAIENERKMRTKNFELSEAMEKHMISMAREAEKLRSELAIAEKRAMASAAAAAIPVPGYAMHMRNHESSYVGNASSDPHAAHQGTFDPSATYGLAAVPPDSYDVDMEIED